MQIMSKVMKIQKIPGSKGIKVINPKQKKINEKIIEKIFLLIIRLMKKGVSSQVGFSSLTRLGYFRARHARVISGSALNTSVSRCLHAYSIKLLF